MVYQVAEDSKQYKIRSDIQKNDQWTIRHLWNLNKYIGLGMTSIKMTDGLYQEVDE